MNHADDPVARLARLRQERAELVASLPAHSVPAAMLIRLEDLDEEIAALERSWQDGDFSTAETDRQVAVD